MVNVRIVKEERKLKKEYPCSVCKTITATSEGYFYFQGSGVIGCCKECAAKPYIQEDMAAIRNAEAKRQVMKEESKYYTPEIEEFHFGLECEYQSLEGWREEIIDEWQLNEIMNHLVEDDYSILDVYRVKHLDREDIESEGWTYIGGDKYINGFIKNGANLDIFISSGLTEICTSSTTTLFKGTIKNISELKRILKQIGI